MGASKTVDATSISELWVQGLLSANHTLTINGLANGARVKLLVQQDGTGSRTLTISAGGYTGVVGISSAADSVSVVDIYGLSSGVYVQSDTGSVLVAPPGGGGGGAEANWLWRADLATTDPNSATIMAQWLTINPTSGRGITANSGWGVATADASPSDPLYAVPITQYAGPLDAQVRIPLGTLPAAAGDGHLTVRDVAAGREHDFWKPVYNSTTGRISSTAGGASFPLGALSSSEAYTGSGNAANFPLRRGIITPEEIAANLIDHPLVFGCPSIGGSAGGGNAGWPGWTPTNGSPPGAGTGWRFPAFHNAPTAGGASGISIPEGTWLALPSGFAYGGLAITAWEKTICAALIKYGMFNRDNSGQTAIYTEDCKNRGDNTALWAGVGITGTYPAFSTAFPWSSLIVKQAPPRLATNASYPTGQ
jgi:hypothetical protein